MRASLGTPEEDRPSPELLTLLFLGQAPAGRAPSLVLNKKELLVVEDESWRP